MGLWRLDHEQAKLNRARNASGTNQSRRLQKVVRDLQSTSPTSAPNRLATYTSTSAPFELYRRTEGVRQLRYRHSHSLN